MLGSALDVAKLAVNLDDTSATIMACSLDALGALVCRCWADAVTGLVVAECSVFVGHGVLSGDGTIVPTGATGAKGYIGTIPVKKMSGPQTSQKY